MKKTQLSIPIKPYAVNGTMKFIEIVINNYDDTGDVIKELLNINNKIKNKIKSITFPKNIDMNDFRIDFSSFVINEVR